MARRRDLGKVAQGVATRRPIGPLAALAPAATAARGTPGVKKLPGSVYDAINQEMTPEFGRWARKNYGVGGKRLIALVYAGEGGGSIDEGTAKRSSAGAWGPGQFIESTRNAYVEQYGIDPWKNDRSAVRGTMKHLRGTGVAGYNPRMPSYTDYVMGQSVDTRPLVTGSYGGRRSATITPAPETRGPRMERDAVEPGGTGIVELLRALEQQKPAPPPSMGVAPPSFAAGPSMPQGYAPVQSGPPAPEDTSLEDLLSLVSPGGTVPRSQVTPGAPGAAPGAGGGGRIGGLPNYGPSGGRNVNVVGQPIDRGGVPTKPYVVHAVDAISDILGSPIELGTGTAHSQFTVDGNVSNHWTGDAIDLPAAGKRLRAIGRSALIAAGMDPEEARRAQGGLYNVNGWQIIFDTDEGGDHRDHAHVRPPPGWRRPKRWK